MDGHRSKLCKEPTTEQEAGTRKGRKLPSLYLQSSTSRGSHSLLSTLSHQIPEVLDVRYSQHVKAAENWTREGSASVTRWLRLTPPWHWPVRWAPRVKNVGDHWISLLVPDEKYLIFTLSAIAMDLTFLFVCLFGWFVCYIENLRDPSILVLWYQPNLEKFQSFLEYFFIL